MILESRLSYESQNDEISITEDTAEKIEALEQIIYEKDIDLK